MSFLASGNFGDGKFTYQDKTYAFDIGGLGVGGFGMSRVLATGTVYNLSSGNGAGKSSHGSGGMISLRAA